MVAAVRARRAPIVALPVRDRRLRRRDAARDDQRRAAPLAGHPCGRRARRHGSGHVAAQPSLRAALRDGRDVRAGSRAVASRGVRAPPDPFAGAGPGRAGAGGSLAGAVPEDVVRVSLPHRGLRVPSGDSQFRQCQCALGKRLRLLQLGRLRGPAHPGSAQGVHRSSRRDGVRRRDLRRLHERPRSEAGLDRRHRAQRCGFRAVAALAGERCPDGSSANGAMAPALPGLRLTAARAGDHQVALPAGGEPRVTLPAAQPRRDRPAAGAARGGAPPPRTSAAGRSRPAARMYDAGGSAAARRRYHERDGYRGPL